MTQTDPSVELFCPGCNYSLRGIDSQRCPECGAVLDWATISRPIIPWVHRSQIGRFAAFVRTVWMTIRRPGMLARDAARPVSYREARLFRIIVVICVAVPLCTAAAVVHAVTREQLNDLLPDLSFRLTPLSTWTDLLTCWVIGARARWIGPVAMLVWLAAATGLAGYFFHPRGLSVVGQNRAVALSNYCCGPLALVLVAAALGGAGGLMALAGIEANDATFVAYGACLVMAELAVAAALFCWWLCTLRVLALTTQCSMARVLTAAVLLPVMWGALAGLLGLGLPAVVGFVRLAIHNW
jgi:hypothetical protein